MAEYLVGIVYHEREAFALWNRGAIEDYESSTGLFVEADTPAEALAWAERAGEALLRHVNGDPSLDWKAFGDNGWLEDPSGPHRSRARSGGGAGASRPRRSGVSGAGAGTRG